MKTKKKPKIAIQKGKMISNPPAMNLNTAGENVREGKKQNKGISKGRTLSLKMPKR